MYKVLMIPDCYYQNHSGAIAARAAAKLFIQLNCEVRIFTTETVDLNLEPQCMTYSRKAYSWKANFFTNEYAHEYENILTDFSPDLIFIFGGIVNKPKYYTEVAKKRGIKVAIFLLVQDFYCANLHAALEDEPCFKCVESSFPNSFLHNCAVKSSIFPPAFLLNYSIIRKHIHTSLVSADFVISSTDEQLKLLQVYGVDSNKLIKCPLFFDEKRVQKFKASKGDYLVVSGQFRREKGLQLLPEIINAIEAPVKIKIPFYNQKEANKAVQLFALQKYIDLGIIETLPNVTWENGGEELLAKSFGVINPTIWPTTTEFVLLETLGYGKPIFTFAVGIHNELIQNDKNGFAAPIRAYKQMAKQIQKVYADEGLYSTISSGAFQLYADMTNHETFLDGLRCLLN